MPQLLRLVLFIVFIASVSRAATPEDTVNAYLAAAQTGDKAAFTACLTDELAASAETTYANLARYYASAEVRTKIVESVSTGPDTYEIKLHLEMTAKEGTDSFSGDETVQLVRKEGRWLMARKGSTRDSSLAVEADADGKKPHDYIASYLAAINADDFEAVLKMYAPAYYERTLQFGAGDPKLQELQRSRIMTKTESYTIDHANCGFHKNSAPGVYSVALELVLTDAYLEGRKAAGSMLRSKKLGKELCFELLDGRWRITSKTAKGR
jgi:hypothetical protein